jgi:hypothetical protein
MNKYQVLSKIAEFTGYGECVVIKQTDWDSLVNWVNSLSDEVLTDRPNFDIASVMFSKKD